MQAEIIAVGDELTSGQRLDTNSQWISQRLGQLGVRTLYHTTVGDDLETCESIFRQAAERADIVVVTGGLGPTDDDLTRQAIAQATGTQLVLDETILEYIRELFASRARSMPEKNRLQAMFPEGSRPIANSHGTAPGIWMCIDRSGTGKCHLFALPGVPAEMFEMWHATVAPAIEKLRPNKSILCHYRLHCFGQGESHIEAMLGEMIRRGQEPAVGITASEGTITLRISAHGASRDECFAAMQPTISDIRESLGPLIFGEQDETLQSAVLRLLAEQNRTLATIEWATAGWIAQALADEQPVAPDALADEQPVAPDALADERPANPGTQVAESKNHYLGGLVVKGPNTLRAMLDVPERLFDSQETTSGEWVERMAAGCKNRFGADYALAVGPFPEKQSKPTEPASFHYALAGPKGVKLKRSPLAGPPAIRKAIAAKQALNLLRRELLGDIRRQPGESG